MTPDSIHVLLRDRISRVDWSDPVRVFVDLVVVVDEGKHVPDAVGAQGGAQRGGGFSGRERERV